MPVVLCVGVNPHEISSSVSAILLELSLFRHCLGSYTVGPCRFLIENISEFHAWVLERTWNSSEMQSDIIQIPGRL